MTVMRVKEHWPQRAGRYGAGLDRDSDRHFVVVVDVKSDDINTIRASGLVPVFNSVHPQDPQQKCREVTGSQRAETWRVWDITAHYSANPGTTDAGDAESEPNPLLRPAVITGDSQPYEKFVTKDRDGDPLATFGVVGGEAYYIEPYEPQKIPAARWIVSFEKNVAILPTWFLSSNGYINQDDFEFTKLGETYVMPAGTALLLGISFSEDQYVELAVEGGGTTRIDFCRIRFQVHYREEGWHSDLENKGWSALNSDDPDDIHTYEIMVEDDAGQRVKPKAEQYLDAEGKPLAQPISSGDIVFNRFDLIPELDFSDLPVS